MATTSSRPSPFRTFASAWIMASLATIVAVLLMMLVDGGLSALHFTEVVSLLLIGMLAASPAMLTAGLFLLLLLVLVRRFLPAILQRPLLPTVMGVGLGMIAGAAVTSLWLWVTLFDAHPHGLFSGPSGIAYVAISGGVGGGVFGAMLARLGERRTGETTSGRR